MDDLGRLFLYGGADPVARGLAEVLVKDILAKWMTVSGKVALVKG